MLARQPPISTIVCSLMTPLAVFALGTGLQIDTPVSDVPTSIEQALIERACSAIHMPPSVEIDAHKQCLSARLVSLRADFGRDLSRLSSADRRRIDTACNGLHPAEHREAYLDCLGDQLGAVRTRLNRVARDPLEEAAVAPSPLTAPAAAPAPPARQAPRWHSATLIGGTVASAIACAGAVLLAARSRRPRRICRICGANVPEADLCPTCRHEAAETLRRGVLERAQNERAQQEEERRQREDEAEQREQKARDDERARIREQELASEREEAARQQQAEQLSRENEAVVDSLVPAAQGEAFDPYVVLGVQREARQEDIRTAYQQAKTKYDSDFVSFLGDEAQAHFRTKAQAVERAYQMLLDVGP
jgi:DnaJ-domain-containing protein 1